METPAISQLQEKKGKRRKIWITSLSMLVFILFLGHFRSESNLLGVVVNNYGWLGLVLIESSLLWWVFDFDVRPRELLPFFLPAILYLLISYLVVTGLPLSQQLFMVVGLTVLYYLLVLALNILNVATVRTVPLERPALSTLFFIGMIMFSLYGLTIIQSGWGIRREVVLFWVALFAFGYSFLSITTGKAGLWFETLIYALVSLKIVILINFWPALPLVAILALVGWSFVFLGVLQHHLNKDLNSALIREYLLITALLLVVFIFI